MSLLLRPGTHAPFIVPYCAFCGGPVERFAFGLVTSPYYVDIEAKCCDHTQGKRISTDELLRLKNTGQKLFLIVKKGRYQGFGEIKRAV